MVVKKTKKGWIVKSKSGKNLSKSYSSEANAKRRLAEIEFFKRQDK